MKGAGFILQIIRKIESFSDGLIAYGYEDSNEPGTHRWWSVCVNDYELYMHDKRFKALSNAWHKAAAARGFKVVFCYCQPQEKKLIKLANDNNLIMNVE